MLAHVAIHSLLLGRSHYLPCKRRGSTILPSMHEGGVPATARAYYTHYTEYYPQARVHHGPSQLTDNDEIFVLIPPKHYIVLDPKTYSSYIYSDAYTFYTDFDFDLFTAALTGFISPAEKCNLRKMKGGR